MMSLEVILLLCAFTVHSTTSQPVLESNISNVGIMGGYRQSMENAPFMASLKIWRKDENDRTYRCGASIIHEQFVLTAASCCQRSVKIEISVGSDRYMGGNIYVSIYNISHELYDVRMFDSNICIIKLNDTLKFGPTISKIALADDSIKLLYRTRLNGFGWGVTEKDWNKSKYLREVSVKYISEAKCKNILFFTENMICTYGNKKDTCDGDGGGPLTIMNAIQVGITSHGNVHCGKGGIYTKVAAMLPWIKVVIQKNS